MKEKFTLQLNTYQYTTEQFLNFLNLPDIDDYSFAVLLPE